MSSLITSKTNPLVGKVIECRNGDNRDFLFIEGQSLLDELLSSSLTTTDVFCVDSKEKEIRQLISSSKKPACRIHVVTDGVMKKMSDVSSPPGIIALAKRPGSTLLECDLTLSSFVLVLHHVQLPQNVGALLRTAEAAGVEHVWCTQETADPYSPKSIRGSMGSVLRLNVKSQLAYVDAIDRFKEEGFTTVATASDGKVRYDQLNWKQRIALVVGNEAAGLSPEELGVVDTVISIPMNGDVDSLNVGVAGAICMFESFRHRGFKSSL